MLLCLYFAAIYILFDTVYTLVSCPYEALTPEMTLDHDERTSLITYRMAVSIVAGLLFALLLGEVVFPSFPDERAAFRAVGLICGAIFVVPLLITFFATRERLEFQVEEAPNPLQGLRYVLRNKEWRYTLAMSLLSWMPVDIASAIFPYFLIYWVGMSEGDASLVLGIILASAALFLPVVLWLSRRLEKKTAFMVATASWSIIMLGLLLIPRGAVTLTYVMAGLAGFGVSSAHLLPRAMGADVLEVDELVSGKRQEGIYSGFNVFVRKLSTGLVLAVIGPALAWSGYVEGLAAQPPAALTTIRLLIAVLPAVLLVAACVVAWFYPLTRQRHVEISQELVRRRAVNR
jgi:GPH family glycoside/pentoside/hexuronide:cation symporter